MRKIDVSIDTFALIWAARAPGENSEDEIIARLAKFGDSLNHAVESNNKSNSLIDSKEKSKMLDKPRSSDWVNVLVWSLRQLGGRAHLNEIYNKSRLARSLVGLKITKSHDASARERLESYCSESLNYKHIADLFYMPEGKGVGVWALRETLPQRYR